MISNICCGAYIIQFFNFDFCFKTKAYLANCGAMAKEADRCTRGMMGLSALCTLQPKSKISQCLKEASQYHEICSKQSGVSAGDSHHASAGVAQGGGRGAPYKKADGKVYVGEVPYNGKHWNGKCYAFYINGELAYWEDQNGNACDNGGVLGGQDNGNARDN